MAFTKDDVLAIATLARLDLCYGLNAEESETRLLEVADQMDRAIEFISILEEVNTDGVEPLFSPLFPSHDSVLPHVAPPREDVAFIPDSAEAVLSNAPERQATFFVVPPVL